MCARVLATQSGGRPSFKRSASGGSRSGRHGKPPLPQDPFSHIEAGAVQSVLQRVWP